MDYLAAKGIKTEWADPENHFIWQAYLDLRTSRNDYGHIPVSEIEAYLGLCGISDNIQRVRIFRLIRELDAVEANHARNEAKT